MIQFFRTWLTVVVMGEIAVMNSRNRLDYMHQIRADGRKFDYFVLMYFNSLVRANTVLD